ncbi:MAG: radical SAM protein [Phycisphaerales bacterium]|nr:radical SAM protein [Phycisphaerales bacterium]
MDTPYGQTLRLPEPLLLSIAITNSCSKPCRHCSASLVPDHRALHVNPVTSTWWRRIIESDIPNVLLTGGEPLHNPSLRSLISTLIEAGKGVFVFTHGNASEVTPLAEEFGARVTFGLSLYGDDRTHDSLRGDGSFASLQETTAKVRQAGGRTLLNCVVSPGKPDGLAYLGSKNCRLRPHRVLISQTIGVGRAGRRDEAQKPERAYSEWQRSIKANLRCPVVVGVNGNDDASSRNRIAKIAEAIVKHALGIKPFVGCSVGQWGMHVSASGSVHMCALGETLAPVGSLTDSPLAIAWQKLQQIGVSQGFGCHVEKATRSKSVYMPTIGVT